MKKYIILFVCLISTNTLFAQGNYAVPDIPAASILSIENTSVSRVSTPKEVAISLLPLINSSEDKPFGLEYNFSKRFNIPVGISIGEISNALSFGIKVQITDKIEAKNKKLVKELDSILKEIQTKIINANDIAMDSLRKKYPEKKNKDINQNHSDEKNALVAEIISKESKESEQQKKDYQELIDNIAWNKESLSFALAGAFYGQTDDMNSITVQDRIIQIWGNWELNIDNFISSCLVSINATGKHRYSYGIKNNSVGVATGVLYGINQIKFLSDLSLIVNSEEKDNLTFNVGGEFVLDKYLVTAKFGYDFINKQYTRKIELRLGI